VSALFIFLFLFSAYYRLTNAPLTAREVLPGTIVSTLALESTFQVLPVYLRLSKHVPALQALGGPAILLVWLYVMANVIVFGAEINWWYAHGREPRAAPARPARGESGAPSSRFRARRLFASRRQG
jgi:membrane protein